MRADELAELAELAERAERLRFSRTVARLSGSRNAHVELTSHADVPRDVNSTVETESGMEWNWNSINSIGIAWHGME
jgi:hypothetical protein